VPGWCHYHGIQSESVRLITVSEQVIFSRHRQDNIAKLINTCREAEVQTPIFVVDVLGASILGSINADDVIGDYISAQNEIGTALGALWISVAHTNWTTSDRASGNYQLWAQHETRLRVVRDDPEERETRLEVLRMKDDEPGEPMNFSLEIVELGEHDGKPLSTLVPVFKQYGKPPRKGSDQPQGANQCALWEIAKDTAARHGQRHQGSDRIPATRLECWGLVVTQADADLLEQYCRIHAQLKKAEGKVAEFGELVKSPNGFPCQSPWLNIVNRCRADMFRIALEFGGSPSSRTRLSIEPAKSSSGKWDGLIA